MYHPVCMTRISMRVAIATTMDLTWRFLQTYPYRDPLINYQLRVIMIRVVRRVRRAHQESTACIGIDVWFWRPAPSNITGTELSQCQGGPCIEATTRPSESLTNTYAGKQPSGTHSPDPFRHFFATQADYLPHIDRDGIRLCPDTPL
jgi:hypothetical protein